MVGVDMPLIYIYKVERKNSGCVSYQIRLTGSHLVVATAGDYDTAVFRANEFIHKYKNRWHEVREWESEYYNTITEQVREQRAKEYEMGGIQLQYERTGVTLNEKKKINFKKVI